MRQATLLIFLLTLTGCGGVDEFERELTGPSAVAWVTCKKAFGDAPLTYPRLIEVDNDRIYFGWETAEAEKNGGPIFCTTNGTGKELLSVRIADTRLDKKQEL